MTPLPARVLECALAAGMLLFVGSDPQRAGSHPGAAAPVKEERAGNVQDIRLTGKVEVSTADKDGDGLFEAAAFHVELEVLTPEAYRLIGTLEKRGRVVSHRPAWDSSRFSEATVAAGPGIHRASLAFSGEEIFRSGEDGPYDLLLMAIGATSGTLPKLQTPFIDHRRFGEVAAQITGASETAVDEDGDGRLDAIRVTARVTVRVAGPYGLDASLSRDGTTLAYASETFSLTAGTQTLEVRVPGLPLLRRGVNGPYEGTVVLFDGSGKGNLGGVDFLSRAYAPASFAPFLETDGRFRDHGIDSNGNGLLDVLRVELDAAVAEPGPYVLTGQLKSPASSQVVFAETRVDLTQAYRTITLDFRGAAIRDQRIDGPFDVEIAVREPDSGQELDHLRLGDRTSTHEAESGQRTRAYRHTDFEPFGWTAIRVTGRVSDEGVDSDGDGLFESLRVELEVELARTDVYEWHATLKDAHGTSIDWSRRKATLQAGTTTLDLVFEGKKIHRNGVDGPYSVEAMGVFGVTGPNVVVSKAARTRFYSFTSFER